MVLAGAPGEVVQVFYLVADPAVAIIAIIYLIELFQKLFLEFLLIFSLKFFRFLLKFSKSSSRYSSKYSCSISYTASFLKNYKNQNILF